MGTVADWCAAIAAIFSAIAAIISLQVSWSMILDSVRPEVVLKEWDVIQPRSEFGEPQDYSVIRIEELRNIGVGPALNLEFAVYRIEEGERRMTTRSHFYQIVYPNEAKEVYHTFILESWGDDLMLNDPPFYDLELILTFDDLRGSRFEVAEQYRINSRGVIPEMHLEVKHELIAPRIRRKSRSVKQVSPWRVRWDRYMEGFPKL